MSDFIVMPFKAHYNNVKSESMINGLKMVPSNSPFDVLGDELLARIFSHLSIIEMIKLKPVSIRWYEVIRNVISRTPLLVQEPNSPCAEFLMKEQHLVTCALRDQSRVQMSRGQLRPYKALNTRCLQMFSYESLPLQEFCKISDRLIHLQITTFLVNEQQILTMSQWRNTLQHVHLNAHACWASIGKLIQTLSSSVPNLPQLTLDVHVASIRLMLVNEHTSMLKILRIRGENKPYAFYQIAKVKFPVLKHLELWHIEGKDLPLFYQYFPMVKTMVLHNLHLESVEEILELKTVSTLQTLHVTCDKFYQINWEKTMAVIQRLSRSLPSCQMHINYHKVSHDMDNFMNDIQNLRLSVELQLKLLARHELRLIVMKRNQILNVSTRLQFVRTLHLKIKLCNLAIHSLSALPNLTTLSISGNCCTNGCSLDDQITKLNKTNSLRAFMLEGSYYLGKRGMKSIGNWTKLCFFSLCSENEFLESIVDEQVVKEWSSLRKLQGICFTNMRFEAIHFSTFAADLPSLSMVSIVNSSYSMTEQVELIHLMMDKASNDCTLSVHLELDDFPPEDQTIKYSLEALMPDNLEIRWVTP